MIEAWIDKEGKIHTGDGHKNIAMGLFPKSRNAELSCEKAGYVKVGTTWGGAPYMMNYDPNTATQAQINSVTKVWDEHYKGV